MMSDTLFVHHEPNFIEKFSLSIDIDVMSDCNISILRYIDIIYINFLLY
jgi:hypothetical protein